MKTKFPAYYRIHQDDLFARFDDCVFIFDACALLDIYRMKKEVTDDVFKVMEHLKEQIRVPYHVAEEYSEKIHEVLNDQIKNIKNSQSDFVRFISSLETKRSQPYISKDASKLLNRLRAQVEKDFKQQEAYIKDQLVYGEHQNRMADLLDGKVLEPFSEEQLAEIEKEGEKRYEDKIPPGYKDATKSSNRYGDLINWKEILRFAKDSGKCIVIVSSEMKEDWVLREQGCSICLRYELLKEFYDTVGNRSQLIHFLSLDRFLEFAREKDDQVISEATVNEVKDYVKLPREDMLEGSLKPSKMPTAQVLERLPFMSAELEAQIDSWRKIQDKLDPKMLQGYREIMEKVGKASFAPFFYDRKASKVVGQEPPIEVEPDNHATQDSSKDKGEE